MSYYNISLDCILPLHSEFVWPKELIRFSLSSRHISAERIKIFHLTTVTKFS